MPGNLEAPLIVSERVFGVKKNDAGARNRPTTPTMDDGPGSDGALPATEIPMTRWDLLQRAVFGLKMTECLVSPAEPSSAAAPGSQALTGAAPPR